jgi:hypothetical protein
MLASFFLALTPFAINIEPACRIRNFGGNCGLPRVEILEKVARYEAHLQKGLYNRNREQTCL